MNIAGTEFSLQSESFDIFISGCNKRCKGCFNPEAQDFNFGEKLNTEDLINKIKSNIHLIKKIRFMGGDLLSQNPQDAFELALIVRLEFPSTIIVLYTGNLETKLPTWCWVIFDEIKCGPFVEDLKCNSSLYGSSNQRYWKKIGEE